MNINDLQEEAGMQLLLPLTGIDDPVAWARQHHQEIDAYLSVNGAMLIRGLKIQDAGAFGALLQVLFNEELADYVYRSTPRTALPKNVYTATEYPASETIPQHNENAYSNIWPIRIGFCCIQKAAVNGNTPICDSRLVYRQIPEEIREEFERKKVMYVRNYADVDLPWTEVFQTTSKAAVEAYCHDHQIGCEWTTEGLRTRQVNQATAVHPVTGDKLWFNQAHLFHISSLNKELQEGLLELLGEENLPRNTYFGDGSPIDEAMLSEIRKVYEDNTICFEWQPGDLLLLDNMLFTHGRQPYEGTRKVLVGMARNVAYKELAN